MKVSFNQTSQVNKFNNINYNSQSKIEFQNCEEIPLPPVGLTLANFHPVTFGKHIKPMPDMEFLLSFADKFKCAYTGRPMINKTKAKDIYQKLEKRPNAQSAVNLLQHMQGYMHDIESIVFDIFSEAPHKSKRDFQDILQEYAPQSLEQLKIKQYAILNSTDRLIGKLSEPVAQQVLAAKQEALTKMEDGTFGRQLPLERIKAIMAKGKDLDQIIKIYRKWYKLPTSSNDLDAFIVKYSKIPHFQIAKRLISSAVVSIEHVQPHSRGGEDRLPNLLLVSSQFNNARNTMPLWEYMMLNPEIDFATNLQNYMNDVISEINNKRSPFSQRGYYPERIKKVIERETKSAISLDTGDLCLSKTQQREMSSLKKLGTVFTMIEK